MDETVLKSRLPGFRFKPTEEELLNFYLKNMVNGNNIHLGIIGLLNIYQHHPCDLPGLAKQGEREWYFFVPRDRKHGNGGRPNRTTEHGFWKATGSDRKIESLSEPIRVIGLRKTLVFYQGRAPRGSKTDWVMNEYRFPDTYVPHKDIVLCKIYRKATSLKELEQRAAKDEAAGKSIMVESSNPTSPFSSTHGAAPLNCRHFEDLWFYNHDDDNTPTLKKEEVEDKFEHPNFNNNNNNIQLPFGKESLGELQVPKLGSEWGLDPIFSQICSPWFENLLNNFSSPTLLTSLIELS